MHVIESPRRLSESLYWKLHGEYFEQRGIAAFTSNEVPFRNTCNPLIANSYAEIIRGYMRDLAKDKKYRSKKQKRIVIIELGSGTGRFSFLLLSALLRLTSGLIHDTLPKFSYLITDYAESNVNFWAEHPTFKPLVEKGIVEFATLDAGDPLQAKLRVFNQSLEEFINGDPVVVIANYLLDVLVHDAFRVEEGKLHEVLVGIDVDEPTSELVGSNKFFKTMKFTKKVEPASLPYFKEPIFNKILEEYVEDLTSGTFLFPVMALRCLEKLRKLAKGQLLLLVTDMARSSINNLEGNNSLDMSLNGAFSSIVNLDAVARWIRHNSGTAIIPKTPLRRLDTYAFLLGQEEEALELSLAFEQQAGRCSPSSYYSLIRRASKELEEQFSAREFLGLLHFSHLDPFMLRRMRKSLFSAIDNAKKDERAALVATLEQCWLNYYSVGEPENLPFLIGQALYRLKEYQKALEYYQYSLDEFGLHRVTFNNIALCHERLGDSIQALASYRKSFELEKNSDVQAQIEGLVALIKSENKQEDKAP